MGVYVSILPRVSSSSHEQHTSSTGCINRILEGLREPAAAPTVGCHLGAVGYGVLDGAYGSGSEATAWTEELERHDFHFPRDASHPYRIAG